MTPTFRCLIDANVLLHFRPPEEVDWRALVGSGDVRLLVGVEVVSELDDHAHNSPNHRLRKRAAAAIKWIETMSERDEIRPGVSFSPALERTDLDWAKRGLDASLCDDRIVGRALLLAEAGERVVLATDDAALRLKARHHGIHCISLSDEDRLPDLKTAEELLVEQQARELSAMRNALPDLRLGFLFADGLVQQSHFVLNPVPAMASDQIARIADEETKQYAYEAEEPPMPSSLGSLGVRVRVARMAMLGRGPTRDELSDYQQRFADYKERYAEHVRRRDDSIHLRSRTVSLPLVVANEGDASADDIHVFIDVPQCVALADVDDDGLPWPSDVAAPEPPTRPWAFALDMTSLPAVTVPRVRHVAPPVPDVSGPVVSRVPAGHQVIYRIRRLKQAMRVELDPLWVYYPSEPFSFSMKYRISSHTRPGVQEGAVSLVTP